MEENRKRSEVLSVKSSIAEKDMILRASRKCRMPYSEFMRRVALAACREMGVEEAQGVTVSDVRRTRPKKIPPAVETVTGDAIEGSAVAV